MRTVCTLLTLGLMSTMAVDAADARKKNVPPATISWFQASAVQQALQGSWKLGESVLIFKGDQVTQIDKDGSRQVFKLLVEQPGRISLMHANGGGVNYAFTTNGETRFLYTGRAGIKHGEQYVVGDGLSGDGVVVFDATKKTCVATSLMFGDWSDSTPVECSLGKKDGHAVIYYSMPIPGQLVDGKPELKRRHLFVVGDALLEEPGGKLALAPAKP